MKKFESPEVERYGFSPLNLIAAADLEEDEIIMGGSGLMESD